MVVFYVSMGKLTTAKRIYSQKGLLELAKTTTQFAYYQAPFTPSQELYQIGKYKNTQKRWKLINANLSEKNQFLLDIGCNAGILTELAANQGLVSLGVDRYQDRYSNAIQASIERFEGGNNIGFINSSITPDNIETFPTYDVVLLMSVYHHWYKEFGKERAEGMLRALRGANRIFFEPASQLSLYQSNNDQNTPIPPINQDDDTSIVDYNIELLESTLGDEYSINCIGSTVNGGIRRHIFVAASDI